MSNDDNDAVESAHFSRLKSSVELKRKERGAGNEITRERGGRNGSFSDFFRLGLSNVFFSPR